VLDVHNVGAGIPAGGEGVFEDDRALLNYLEHVSYAKIFIWLAVLCWADVLFFPYALHLTKSRIAEKSAVVQQNARVVQLEEANAQLLEELDAAQSRLAEVEHHEHALTSDYEGLHRDFDDLRTLHDAIVKEKADLEKTECEKAQWFQNSLR
jgi:hypothetical protein